MGNHYNNQPRIVNYQTGRARLTNRRVQKPLYGGLKKDDGMNEWLKAQDWSEFAQSLSDFYSKRGGFTDGQYASAMKMRQKLDEFYDPYGKSIDNGVYLDVESELIYKLAWQTRNDFKSRSVRMRHISSPNWRDVKNRARTDFFDDVTNGGFRKLTEEEIIKIGKDTGICCVCGKVLDNPQSIAAGIGPYCAKQQREQREDGSNGNEID
jgi:hypothetical protein